MYDMLNIVFLSIMAIYRFVRFRQPLAVRSGSQLQSLAEHSRSVNRSESCDVNARIGKNASRNIRMPSTLVDYHSIISAYSTTVHT